MRWPFERDEGFAGPTAEGTGWPECVNERILSVGKSHEIFVLAIIRQVTART